jgi:hypothetical protein
MSNSRRNLDKAQQTDGDTALRQLLSQAIRSCPLSRVQICEALTRRLGVKVKPFMLDSYTAESKKPARFPAAWVPALCEVTGNNELQRRLLSAGDRQFLDLGERTAEWAWALRKVRAELARLNGEGHRKKRDHKRTRKA